MLFLQPSLILRNAWSAGEDRKLLEKVRQYGPVWHLIQRSFIGRTPKEVHYRWIHVSGLMDRYRDHKAAQRLLIAGYEPHSGNHWLKFPLEDGRQSPYARLRALLPTYPRRRLKKAAGWPEIEQMAVQQAYDEHGPNWKFIAATLHRRTPDEVRVWMEDRHARFNGVYGMRWEQLRPPAPQRTVTVPSEYWAAGK